MLRLGAAREPHLQVWVVRQAAGGRGLDVGRPPVATGESEPGHARPDDGDGGGRGQRRDGATPETRARAVH